MDHYYYMTIQSLNRKVCRIDNFDVSNNVGSITVERGNIKVSVTENEVPTEKNSSCASIFATKASYISN